MTLAIILVVVIIFIIVWAVGIFNRLVKLRNRFKNAFAQIDVQLKRRYDLIPNLVETAKGYLKHERETLEAVINARNQAASAGKTAADNPGDPDAMKGLMGAETLLTGALGRFFALAEAYPDLKANQNSEPEHDAAERGAHLDREQGLLRPPGLQRRRHELQHSP
jgi:LemA protein